MLFAVIGMLLVLNVDTPINCQVRGTSRNSRDSRAYFFTSQALYSFAQFAGNSAIGSASTLLMLRTIAIWNRNLFVTIPLVVLSCGQWGILFHGTERSSAVLSTTLTLLNQA